MKLQINKKKSEQKRLSSLLFETQRVCLSLGQAGSCRLHLEPTSAWLDARGVEPAQFAVSTYCPPLQVCCCVFRCLPCPALARFLTLALPREYADGQRRAENSKMQVLL